MNKKSNFDNEINEYASRFSNSTPMTHYVLFAKNDISHKADSMQFFTKVRSLSAFKLCPAIHCCLCHILPRDMSNGCEIKILKEVSYE